MKARHAFLAAVIAGSATLLPAFDFGGVLKSVGEKVAEKSVDPNAQKAFSGLTIQEEIDIGDSVSVEIVGRYGGIWRDKVATQRVNLVGRALAKYAKRDSLDWRFGLLDSDAINAFSAPNGRVFITKGLYKLLADDDELAGVLAHEIGHIDLKHAAKVIEGKLKSAQYKEVGGAVLSDQVAGSKLADLPMASQFVENMTGIVVDGLIVNGYPSKSEYEADAAGYELAKATGFNPEGLRIALEKVEANTKRAKETFNTHPKTKDRLKKLPGGKKGKR